MGVRGVALAEAVAAARATFAPLPVPTPLGTMALPAVMVAIAGAESGWDARCAGDGGLRGPSCAGLAAGRPVPAATSFGLWQIHTVHGGLLRAAAGSDDACAWAEWLYDPLHNAQAAAAILGAGTAGLRNWTSWGNARTPWAQGEGPYRRFLAQAAAALAP